LSGHKSFVLSGPRADTFLVSARVADLRKDETGLALFVVPRDAAGLACRDFVTMDGRGATELTLDDVRVEQDDRLTLDGEGENVIEACTQYAIAGTCAEAIGAMDDVVKVTASYLKTRRAYGTTLNTFQALQHRMADMLVELEMSRSMLLRLLAAFSREDALTRRRTVSAAKALIGGSAKFIASHGIQLHGAMGMVAEYVIGRHFKQLTMLETLFGNSSFHWERCVGLSFAEPVADNDKTERPVPARSSVQAI
jgi:alkylation response protein AidB-like acyl-CoA dehydrogenase